MHRGIATFTLDTGTCPRWLFERMVRLGREITRVLIEEYGSDEYIRRLGDPVWFQSLGTVLAFDWNASGLTTILTAALKEAIRGHEKEWGVFICGGKGKTSRKTPGEITAWGERLNLAEKDTSKLVYNSRISAKVDSALVQDGFQIYHHSFMFSKNGAWTVVQQGMNTENLTARRYHWHSSYLHEFVNEPHSGIASPYVHEKDDVLNMTSRDSVENRNVSLELVRSGYTSVMKEIKILRRHTSALSRMASVEHRQEQFTFLELPNHEFRTHPVIKEDFSKSAYLERVLERVCETKPVSYENLVAQPGVGSKTIRALSLVSEVIYGAAASYQDPARYSFAHGGKDATPFPVDRLTYDKTISILKRVISRSRVGYLEKYKMLTRLKKDASIL